MRTSLVVLALFLLIPLTASDAFAHGGVWRGPRITPTPLTPPPPTIGPGTSTPASPVTPPVTPRGHPAPTPNLPGVPGGLRVPTPLTPGTPPVGPVPQPLSPRPRRGLNGTLPPSGPNISHWSFWWELNRERLLDLRAMQRERLARRTTPSPHVFGEGDEKNRRGDRDTGARESLLEALRAAARDGNADVATGAIIALGKAGDARAVPLLMSLVESRSSDATVRESAALALGMIGEASAEVRPFLARLTGDKSIRLRSRAFAALGLGFLGDPGAIPILMRRARTNAPSRDVPACAILGLGLLGDEMVVPDLAAGLSGTKSRRIRDGYLRAYTAAALGLVRSRAGLPAVTSALRDPDREVRRQAVLSAGALATARDEPVIRTLLLLLGKDRDTQVRAFAAVTLGELGAPAAADSLLYAYRKGDGVTVAYAAIGLGLLARNTEQSTLRERIVPFLRAQFMERGNNDLRGALAIALGIARDDKAVKVLTRVLTGKGDPTVRSHVAVALGLIGDESSVKPLRAALQARGQPDLQKEAALALALLGDRDAEGPLADIVRSAGTEFVRGSAAVALGRLASPRTAGILRDVLADRTSAATTRSFCAVALGQVLERHPVPILTRVGERLNYRMAVEAIAEILTFL